LRARLYQHFVWNLGWLRWSLWGRRRLLHAGLRGRSVRGRRQLRRHLYGRLRLYLYASVHGPALRHTR
jgi:hypothetical protein